jgi:hypothetical protein
MTPSVVIPGLVPGIHVFNPAQDVDGRGKPGHDVEKLSVFDLDAYQAGMMAPLKRSSRNFATSGDW